MNFNKEKVMSGSGPIHKHDISDTVKVIANLVEIFPDELMDGLLGSAGKQEVSGDIDLAIEDTLENIVDVLERNNASFKVNKGLNCVHLLVEIKGPKREIPNYTGKVQADLFFGEKEWLKFSHFSAGDKSKYKGMYRTILLSSIISAITDFVDYDEGQLIAKVGPILNLGEGIRTQYRIAPAKKNGQGYLKKLIEVKADDRIFNNRYGTIKTQHININTPREAVSFIFGPKTSMVDGDRKYNDITAQDLGSFEKVHRLMLERIPIKKQQIIQKIFRNRTGFILSISEAQLDTSTYGSWIFPNGKIDPVINDGHIKALQTYYQRPDMVKPDDQDKLMDMAFQDGLVRVVHISDKHIELHGRKKDLRKTFKIWWKSAISSDIVYIDIQEDLESFNSYKFKMPMEKEKLRQLLHLKSSSQSVNEGIEIEFQRAINKKYPELSAFRLSSPILRDDRQIVNIDNIRLERKNRDKGIGSSVIKELISWADQNNIWITLQLADKKKNTLIKFYRRFGFVQNKGRNKDFSLSLYTAMYRKPKEKVNESQLTQMPWNSDPIIGWWLDNETITFYHGTHKDNVASILKNGLFASETGRTAGTTYLALDPFTGKGYGSMAGEIEFKAAGRKAKHVPMEDRATIVFEFPRLYVEQNMSWNNPKLVNRESYEKFVGSDTEYYELSEVKHPGNISSKFIVGYM